MPITAADIFAILRDELLLEVEELNESSPLFTSGIVDSFSLVGLINEVERRGGFRVAPLDITIENFDSVERIVRYLDRQQLTDRTTSD